MITLYFHSTDRNESESRLRCFANNHNELFIEIDDDDGAPPSYMCLDKDTAIKLAKEIRKQVSFLED